MIPGAKQNTIALFHALSGKAAGQMVDTCTEVVPA
jgi:hypothetical protein